MHIKIVIGLFILNVQKLAQKVAEKCQEDDSFLEKVRQNYIARLRTHLLKDGTIDPTEGTIKYYAKYKADDPLVPFMAEYDGTELVGEKWDAEWDCMYLKEACDGAGWFLNYEYINLI